MEQFLPVALGVVALVVVLKMVKGWGRLVRRRHRSLVPRFFGMAADARDKDRSSPTYGFGLGVKGARARGDWDDTRRAAVAKRHHDEIKNSGLAWSRRGGIPQGHEMGVMPKTPPRTAQFYGHQRRRIRAGSCKDREIIRTIRTAIEAHDRRLRDGGSERLI